MKLLEYHDIEWTGNYTEVGSINSIRILLLDFNCELRLREEGRRNLLAIDLEENVLWVANPPSIGYNYGVYKDPELIGTQISVWYGGSVYVIIDPVTGRILDEKFIK